MPTHPDDKIRLSVWLACLAPVIAVVAAGVYLLTPSKSPGTKHARTATADVASAPDESADLPAAAPTSPAPSAPPPPPMLVAPSSAPPPSGSPSADPLPEIDAILARPPDSAHWTVEQKNAYRAQLAEELRVRERNLEGEIAAAHRSGDSAAEQTKTATLADLRRRREALESPLRPTVADDGGS